MKYFFNVNDLEFRLFEKLKDDDVEITKEKHDELFNAINSGCVINSDLTYSNARPSPFHTEFNRSDWIDPRSEEEKLAYKRLQYPRLTRYQFMRGMLEMGFKSSDIEAQIMLIEDEYTRELTMLGFKDAGYFDRNDQSIGVMRDFLEKTDLDIDEFW